LFRLLKKYGWIIGSCLVGIVVLFVTSKSEPKKAIVVEDNASNDVSSPEESAATSEESYTIVDVKGEVNDPGVYQVEHDSRVDDVIALAGGFTEDADELQVNQAQKVHDEMVIYVPTVDETGDITEVTSSASVNETGIRINYATKEEIMELPGIGPSKADAIIQYREEHGSFSSEDDLLEVSGIGEKTLDSLREFIQIP